MPQAGSGGAETYNTDYEPQQAVEGDYWYDGLTLRVRTRTRWITVGGPSDTSALSPTA